MVFSPSHQPKAFVGTVRFWFGLEQGTRTPWRTVEQGGHYFLTLFPFFPDFFGRINSPRFPDFLEFYLWAPKSEWRGTNSRNSVHHLAQERRHLSLTHSSLTGGAGHFAGIEPRLL